MISRRCLLQALPAVALGVWLPAEARATLARAVPLGRLVEASRYGIVGTPLEASSRWERRGKRRRIVTYTRVRVEETFGGAEEAEVLVRTLGGRVDEIGQIVHGEALLAVNRPAVLFLEDGPSGSLGVTAMGQGEYPLLEKGGIRRLSLSPRVAETIGDGGAGKVLNKKELGAARSLIVKEWARAR